MRINREILLMAGDELETVYPGIKRALEALPEKAPPPPSRSILLDILVGAASAAALADGLYKLMAASNRFLDKIDVKDKTDAELLMTLRDQWNNDYFFPAKENASKILVIITALTNAVKKKFGL